MTEFVWIDRRIVIAAHDEQLAEHGGGQGLRDEGHLDLALMRPENIAAYEPDADVFRLAAAYACGLAKNHPFIDGNKRIAFVAMRIFLLLNGHDLRSNDVDNVLTMLKLASGEMNEDELVTWLRDNTVRE